MLEPPPSVAQRFSDTTLAELNVEFIGHIKEEKLLHDQQVALQQDHSNCLNDLTKRVETLEAQNRLTTLQLETVLTKINGVAAQLQTVLNIVEQSKGAWKLLGIISGVVVVVGGFVAWALNHLSVIVK